MYRRIDRNQTHLLHINLATWDDPKQNLTFVSCKKKYQCGKEDLGRKIYPKNTISAFSCVIQSKCLINQIHCTHPMWGGVGKIDAKCQVN